jgi:hypothetical protein
MNNVMLDLETLGTHPGCVVLSIGAVMFDETGPLTEYYAEISQASSEAHGLRADMSTVFWWNQQGAEARSVLERTSTGINSTTALPVILKQFATWLPPGAIVWGNGASFDNAILAQCYRQAGMGLPWKHWNDRCYRTLKNLAPDVPFERSDVHHNALDDARSQASHASAILRRLQNTP